MSDPIYVSSEEDLKASLTENHKLTVIKANYEPEIFKDYNIRYCFNEKADPKCINFKSLKHVFDPDRSYDVIFNSNIYMSLLEKVKNGEHSVVFILSLKNVKLLRLCECFISAVNKLVENGFGESFTGEEEWFLHPYVIGQAEVPLGSGLWIPVWSSSRYVILKTLEDVLMDTLSHVFGGIYYSEEGRKELLTLLKSKVPEITGAKKLRIYKPYSGCHFRQDIEGPHEMLDTTDFVKKIESAACSVLQSLKKYEINIPIPYQQTPYFLHKFAKNIPGCEVSGPYKICDSRIDILPLFFEYLRIGIPKQEQDAFCAHASGELMVPTPEAIEQRVYKFGDNYCCYDGMGNIYAFAYKMYDMFGKSKIAVCPEGKEALITDVFGVQADNNNLPSVQASNVKDKHDNNSEKQIKPSVIATTIEGISSVHDGTACPTPNKNGTQTTKSHILFESLRGKTIRYKVDGIDKKTSIRWSSLRFLAFCAGIRQGYCFIYKNKDEDDEKGGVWLIKDDVPSISLNELFKGHGDILLDNIPDAIPQMIKPFLPSSANKANLSMLFKKKDKQYPKIERLKNGKYNKIEPDYDGKYQQTENGSVFLSLVELLDCMSFEITLAPDLKSALQKLPEYNRREEFKTIIDFILSTF
jgi:hypothetical protein